MNAARNRLKHAKPCRPRHCETQCFLVPSTLAPDGIEPRPSAPLGGGKVHQVFSKSGVATSVGAMS